MQYSIDDQIEYVLTKRNSLTKTLEEAPDIIEVSNTIEMLRAIEESLGEVKLLAVG